MCCFSVSKILFHTFNSQFFCCLRQEINLFPVTLMTKTQIASPMYLSIICMLTVPKCIPVSLPPVEYVIHTWKCNNHLKFQHAGSEVSTADPQTSLESPVYPFFQLLKPTLLQLSCSFLSFLSNKSHQFYLQSVSHFHPLTITTSNPLDQRTISSCPDY